MDTTWIVAADSSRARILQVAGRDQPPQEIDTFDNPAGRLDGREINTDAFGRFPGGNTQDTGTGEHQAEMFAKRIGEYLEKARTDHRYDRLCLRAAPKFLGALRKGIGTEVAKLVVDEQDSASASSTSSS